MKIEHLLARHLYSAKKLTLQGIGTFALPQDFVMPAETDKISEIPQGAITFAQNLKAAEDEALIDFIVQQTRKMKPLASADLESFLGLGTQFLNIGKPFKLDGIGMLEKNQLGEYQFTQYGQIVTVKAEDTPVLIKEKKEESISFGNEETKAGGGMKKLITGLLALIILGGAGWAAWYFFINKKATPETVQQSTPATLIPVTDTAKKDTAQTVQKPDSIKTTAPLPVNNGSYTFKVVLKNYPSLVLAQKAFERLVNYGHKPLLYTNDSVTYKIAIPLSLPLSDTAYAKDSLHKFFNAKTYVELK